MGARKNYSVPNYVILSKIMLQALWMAKYCPQHPVFKLYVIRSYVASHNPRKREQDTNVSRRGV